jgi:hypothetical protein
MLVDVYVSYGQPEAVFDRRVERDPVGRARQVLTVDEHARHSVVVIHQETELAAPKGTWKSRDRQTWQIQGRQLKVVATCEAARRVVLGFVLDDSGERRATPETESARSCT